MSVRTTKSNSNNMIPQSELWIGGKQVKPGSNAYFEDLNPLDDSLYSRAALATVQDIDLAVQTAHNAFQSYRHVMARDREKWLSDAAALVERDAQEYIDILVDEVGSPLFKAQFEVDYCIRAFRAASGVPRRLHGNTLPSDRPGAFSMTVREPVGVVAGITPFNVPLLKASKQAAMALATGNTMVQLPSEHAPQITVRLAQTIHEAGFPPGTFNLVTGNPFEIGDSLTTHPLIKAICFCGSARIGQHVAELAAKRLVPITLELGGKNPFIVLADADIDAAAAAAAQGIFFFQGQACMGASRMIIERPVVEAFTQKFAAIAENIGMGDLRDIQTGVGPIISPRQRERVRHHVEDAVAKGARLEKGGRWVGNRCQPTILSNVTREMTVFAEETFGPVTSVFSFDTIEEALALANDTEYGLSFGIFTRDIEKAMYLARGAAAGMVHINGATIQDEPHVPFGGTGLSGYGREGTEADLEIMTEWKWITIQLPPAG
jgi:acyl-CoA reductase-like NAD-dependent aldehyde dehydrogenase